MKRWIMTGLCMGLAVCGVIACGRQGQNIEESRREDSVIVDSQPSEDSRNPARESEEEKESSKTEPTFTFEVTEGQLSVDIFQALVERGYGSDVREWIQLEQEIDCTQYQWLSRITNAEERCFFTEGYIMPGRYEWPLDAESKDILNILLQGWDQRLSENMQKEIERFDYSMDDILTMASIVEWEAVYGTEASIKPKIAAVILNRIQQGIPLQMDTSFFYLQAIQASGEKDIAPYEDTYDTYQCPALPPGPICNPSLSAVEAVIHAADTEDLFFVYQVKTGDYYFAQTYEEHLQNIERAGIQ